MAISAASQEHVCTCYFDKFPQRLTNGIDDGVVAKEMLAKRSSETNRSVVQATEASNARHQHVRVFVLCCEFVSHLIISLFHSLTGTTHRCAIVRRKHVDV